LTDWHHYIRSHALGVALVFSLAVHTLILAIKFAPDIQKRIKDNLPALEVVLVNSKSLSQPEKAEALAQANLDRGGNTDADRRMKSPLPVPNNQPLEVAAKPGAEAGQKATKSAPQQAEEAQKKQRVAELEKQAQEMMTQIQATQAVESKPVQTNAAPKPENGQQENMPTTVNTANLAARSLEAARLEAEISKDWDNYQKRPKRKFIGATVREYRFATYVEAWRQKVERIGNLNYPEAAKEQKLYGQLRMTVNIKADGSVESIELNKSSGHKVLDEAARRIVELAAPYAAFPPDISKDTEIISITRTWTFTQEDALGTTASDR